MFRDFFHDLYDDEDDSHGTWLIRLSDSYRVVGSDGRWWLSEVQQRARRNPPHGP
jgi:hypothetical protein